MNSSIRKGGETARAFLKIALALGIMPALSSATDATRPLDAKSALMSPSLSSAQGDEVQPGNYATPRTDIQSPIQWGPFVLHPRFFYDLIYVTGILAQPGHPVSSLDQTFSPGLLLNIGSHWNLDYSPAWQTYSNSLFQKNLEQRLALNGKVNYGDWALGASQNYSRSSNPLIQTGSQVLERDFGTGLSASYGNSNQTLVELAANQQIRFSQISGNVREWSTQDWFHHPVSRKVDLALGLGAGYVAESPGINMAYGRSDARVIWKASEKILLDVAVGGESREFIHAGLGHLNSLIFDGSIAYQPFPTTDLRITADRGIEPSYVVNEIDQNTRLSLLLQQRFLQRFYLTSTLSHQTIAFHQNVTGAFVGRYDRVDTIGLSVGTLLLKRMRIAVEYQHSRDASSQAAYQFSSNQIGISLGISY